MPDGRNIVGKSPSHVQVHYDFELKSYILYQYFHCHVTQPLLLEQLWEWGAEGWVLTDCEYILFTVFLISSAVPGLARLIRELKPYLGCTPRIT